MAYINIEGLVSEYSWSFLDITVGPIQYGSFGSLHICFILKYFKFQPYSWISGLQTCKQQ